MSTLPYNMRQYFPYVMDSILTVVSSSTSGSPVPGRRVFVWQLFTPGPEALKIQSVERVHFQWVRRAAPLLRPHMEGNIFLRRRTALWLVTAENRSWLVQARKAHLRVHCVILWSMAVKTDRSSRVTLLKRGRNRMIWEHTVKQTVLLMDDSAFMLVFE